MFDAEAEDTSLFLLSDTQAMFAYRDSGNSYYGTAMVINLDTSRTLTPGTPFVFSSESTRDIAGVALSETNAIVAYQESHDYGELRIIDVNGTVGSATAFNTTTYPGMIGGEASTISIAVLPNEFADYKIIIGYRHYTSGGGGECRACVASIINNTVNVGKPILVKDENYVAKTEIIVFSTTKILVNGIYGLFSKPGTVCLLSKE